MSNLPILTLDDAPAAVRGTLEAVTAKYGFLPNLIGGLANAPSAMEGYLLDTPVDLAFDSTRWHAPAHRSA